jgi:hypothetical protein
MESQPIGPLMQLLSSNQDIQKDINALEMHMQTLVPGSPEYRWDKLHLELDLQKQKIREENPDLNPLNPEDAKKLEEMVERDSTCQAIQGEINEMLQIYGSTEAPKWGIPFYFSKAVPV